METVLSILMLAVIVMALGAYALWRRGGQTKQAMLMLLLAIVAAVNVAIWVMPDPTGVAPVDRELR